MTTSTTFKSKGSRVGKKSIIIPKGVTVTLKDDVVTVKGKNGTLEQRILPEVIVTTANDKINVEQNSNSPSYGRKTRAVQGLIRSLINNMVIGVSVGFTKELEIIGVGYKAEVKGKKLILNLGYSHLIDFPFPEGITIDAKVGPQSTLVTIKGYDKQHVNQTAAVIRGYRSPDAYKGKGVRYKGETIRLKDGKK